MDSALCWGTSAGKHEQDYHSHLLHGLSMSMQYTLQNPKEGTCLFPTQEQHSDNSLFYLQCHRFPVPTTLFLSRCYLLYPKNIVYLGLPPPSSSLLFLVSWLQLKLLEEFLYLSNSAFPHLSQMHCSWAFSSFTPLKLFLVKSSVYWERQGQFSELMYPWHCSSLPVNSLHKNYSRFDPILPHVFSLPSYHSGPRHH